MEIKAKLEKPYTERKRLDFIVENNHNLGYVIKEDEFGLEAWGLEDSEILERAKEEKYKEALHGAYEWQEKGYVEYKEGKFEFSQENRNNLRDTYEALLALGETTTLWNDKDDKIIELNLDDIQYIRLNLILSAIKKIWIEDYPKYLALIQEAKSLEEVEEIVINYSEQM